jgi:L-alanine-DL-glutamate epimerase-like enolase superfamily enzyme
MSAPELKITKIDVFTVDLPYSGGIYHLSEGRTYTHFDATIVRITARSSTGNDLEGWGESTPFGTTYAPLPRPRRASRHRNNSP